MTQHIPATLADITKAAKTYAAAKRHAERTRAEMGDEWADELIAHWRAEGLAVVASYMTGVTAQDPDIRAAIEANLSRDFD